MHLDGFMDVTDAVKSWRDLERRREILKDSHVGAFAVIACGALMIMQFASSATVAGNLLDNQIELSSAIVCLMLIPVVSRCCSGLALAIMPVMSTSQYSGNGRKSQAVVFIVMMVLSMTAGFVLAGKYGFVILGCVAGYALALVRAYRSLKGVNGDVAGYSLTIGELCSLIVMALL
jgi:adenosylcobinamide-GDP ribazoletransferase